MINPTREQVALALFAQLQTVGSAIKTYSRRPAIWPNTVALPALYMGQTEEDLNYSGDNTALYKNVLYFAITLYINVGLDPNAEPDTPLNALLDAIDTVMAPPPTNPTQQTLGGLVTYARREGNVIRAPGYIDGQGGAFFKIKVLVP